MTFKFRPVRILAPLIIGLLVSVAPARAVQFRLLGWASPDVNLQFETEKKPVETTVYTDNFSAVYDFKGEGPLVLYKMVEREGKPTKQVACTVTLPVGAQQGFIILVPGDDSKIVDRKVLPNKVGFVSDKAPLVYNYIWIDDSPAARALGTVEFRNMSRLPIALQIGQHQLSLAPQAKAQVPLAKDAKRMAFKAAAQINGRWKVFASNPLPTRKPERMMVILRDGPPEAQQTLSPDEPNISMIALYDWPSAPESTPPAPSLASMK